MFLQLEPGPSPCAGHQLSLLPALDAATPPDARPPTEAMLRALAPAVFRPDGEVKPGALLPGAYYALCAAMASCGLVRVEGGAVTITVAGRVAVVAAKGERWPWRSAGLPIRAEAAEAFVPVQDGALALTETRGEHAHSRPSRRPSRVTHPGPDAVLAGAALGSAP